MCIESVKAWMSSNRLCLNPSKTELIWLGSSCRMHHCRSTGMRVSDIDLRPVDCVRDLGVLIDRGMTLARHVNCFSGVCFFQLRQLLMLWCTLIHTVKWIAIVKFAGDKWICNRWLYSHSKLIGVITNTSKYQHITPTLKKLHWLPIKQRIDNKLCLLTYKTLTNQQPTYVGFLLYNSFSFPSHFVSTRSSDFYPFHMSDHHLASVIGPRLGNSLPSDTRNLSFLPTFRSRLKTHLFKIAFPP